MTTQSTTETGNGRRFVLAPNVAPDWRQTMRIFAGISFVCLAIALTCTWFGFWPVLPFAGIELMALWAGLYISARRSLDREVIHIEGGAVRVEKGRGRAEHRWELDRAWTEVVLKRLPRRWEHTQLVLRSRDRQVTLGEFLEPEERRSLARELSRCIGPMASWGRDDAVPAVNESDAAVAPAIRASHSLGDRTG